MYTLTKEQRKALSEAIADSPSMTHAAVQLMLDEAYREGWSDCAKYGFDVGMRKAPDETH